MERIAGLEPGERDAPLAQLMVLAGLRNLGSVIEEEAKKMPILNDILDHEVLGREYKKGLEAGVQQGRQRGVQEGEAAMIRRQIAERFGAMPVWAQERLAQLSAPELEEVGVRLLKANSVEELFR